MSAGSGPNASMPSARSAATAGAMTARVFAADRAAFAGMRIEAGDGEPRAADAEPLAEIRGDDARRRRRSARVDSAAGTSASGMWMVTGTVRRAGPASIITALSGLPFAPMPDGRGIRCGRDSGSQPRRAPSWRSAPVTTAEARPAKTSSTARSIDSTMPAALPASQACQGCRGSRASTARPAMSGRMPTRHRLASPRRSAAPRRSSLPAPRAAPDRR